MNTRDTTGEEEIRDFRLALYHLLGHEEYPAGTTVDLSDLLGTLKKTVSILEQLRVSRSGAESTKLVHEIEILIDDDLPMIFKDLLPNLKAICDEAYEKWYPDDGPQPLDEKASGES